MKRAATTKILFRDENNEFLGFALEANFYAEHEWGIKEMQRLFGIKILFPKEEVEKKYKNILSKFFYKMNYDLPVSHNSKNLRVIETKDTIFLCPKDYEIQFIENKCYFLKDEITAGMWDSKSFVIALKNTEENKQYFNELIKAEAENQLVIGFFPELAKDLIIAKLSNFPISEIENYKEKRKDAIKLYEDFHNTKIEKILKENNKKFNSLTPKYIEGKLCAWLNPTEQYQYNYGWFSIEDLKLWADNKGPILKRKD